MNIPRNLPETNIPKPLDRRLEDYEGLLKPTPIEIELRG